MHFGKLRSSHIRPPDDNTQALAIRTKSLYVVPNLFCNGAPVVLVLFAVFEEDAV
jgi:hypothetical protein